jgi:hypothetical protein
MSATGQGTAGGDAAQAQQGQVQGGGTEGQQQGGADFSQALEILQQQGAGQEEMRQQLQQLAQMFQTQQEQGQAEESIDFSFLDPSEPTYDPEQVAQRLQGLVEQTAEQRAQDLVSQHIDPLRSELSEVRQAQAINDFAAEFPDVGENPEAFVDLASKAAEQIGRPDLAENVGFWRIVRLAAAGAEAAQDQGSEQPNAAHLEGGGGATPAGGSQVDLGDMIVNAKRGGDAMPW